MIKLSELEERALLYLNNSFPLRVSDNIKFGIGDVRVFEIDDYEGVCFKVRRIYKGIPFEYGSSISSNQFNDEYKNDSGEIDFVECDYPDTILGFDQLSGNIEETKNILSIIPIDKALDILSKKIGKNSIYDVYGIELVYRECVTHEQKEKGVEAILKPMWKIITINQNDDKYTMFYIDVVSGDITERFEYYYE